MNEIAIRVAARGDEAVLARIAAVVPPDSVDTPTLVAGFAPSESVDTSPVVAGLVTRPAGCRPRLARDHRRAQVAARKGLDVEPQ